ncbi:MAG: hypothetical protein KGR24_03290 [Planctomycetes bacterium]|nr:hypothetical protein [Planctomycetota bacterium]
MAASDVEHLHQLAVHAFYVGETEVGLRACERLLSERLTPERERLTRCNRTWYTPELSVLADCVMQQIDIQPAHPGWTLFNPSICSRPDGGYALIVRSSNYRCVDGRYVMPEEDAGRIRTENLLCQLDDGLMRQGGTMRLAVEYDRSEFPVDGLEDLRLNVVQGELVGSATCRNIAGRDGLARIATVSLAADALRPEVLDEPVPGRHEKNWMPILGTSSWLYSCHEDGRVVTASRQGDRWVLTPRGSSPALARGFRGGTQLVPCDGGWLACVHEVADDEGRRSYEHRWVWFDAELAIVGWSSPFVFRAQRQIEFAAGLAWYGDRLVCTFGVRDEQAWLSILNYQQLVRGRVSA